MPTCIFCFIMFCCAGLRINILIQSLLAPYLQKYFPETFIVSQNEWKMWVIIGSNFPSIFTFPYQSIELIQKGINVILSIK